MWQLGGSFYRRSPVIVGAAGKVHLAVAKVGLVVAEEVDDFREQP